MQSNSVGQMRKLVNGNGHDFGAETEPPTDVDLDGVNSASASLSTSTT
jgi:hypothetical protein